MSETVWYDPFFQFYVDEEKQQGFIGGNSKELVQLRSLIDAALQDGQAEAPFLLDGEYDFKIVVLRDDKPYDNGTHDDGRAEPVESRQPVLPQGELLDEGNWL